MQAEIVTIGTELLLGEIVDTNSAWIAQQFTTIGLNLYYTTTVGDNLARIAGVLRESLERSDLIITTGGLGPTVDDVTREAVAAAMGREVVLDEDLVAEITAMFDRRHHHMTDNNRRQARLPAGAQVIHNPVGTAPCFWIESERGLIISLPGVPHEMRYLMENEVLPLLRDRLGLSAVIGSRVLHTCGIGESTVDSRMGDLMEAANPTVGTRAHPGQTDICITAKADSEAALQALIAPVEAELRRRLGPFIFGEDEENLPQVTMDLAAEQGHRVAVVETVSGGRLARMLSGTASAREAFAGGICCPDGLALEKVLGIPGAGKDTVAFPSQEMADRAAQAVRELYGASLGLAVVGAQDSASQRSAIYLSLATGGGTIPGARRYGREGAVAEAWLMHLALDLLRRWLLNLPTEWR